LNEEEIASLDFKSNKRAFDFENRVSSRSLEFDLSSISRTENLNRRIDQLNQLKILVEFESIISFVKIAPYEKALRFVYSEHGENVDQYFEFMKLSERKHFDRNFEAISLK